MELQRWHAMKPGPVQLPDGEPAELVVEDLGLLQVRSGCLAVAYTTLLDAPLVLQIPPGSHRVLRTTAIVDETYDWVTRRDAYVSIILSDEETVTLEPAALETTDPAALADALIEVEGNGTFYGVETLELGALTVVDANEIFRGMPVDPATWYDEVISPNDGTGWFDLMDTEENGPFASANVELPRGFNGVNAITFAARDNQLSPLIASRDAAGQLTGIHIDMLVIGELSERLNAYDTADESAIDYVAQEELEKLRLADKQKPRKPRRRGLFGLFNFS